MVREVDATTGDITTVAGNGTAGSSGDGGLATSAELDEPEGLAVDSQGDLFIGDANNCRIQEVNHSTQDISTVAGGTCGSSGNAVAATSAELQGHLPGLAVDASGNLYIADYYNDLIRMVAQACSSSCPFGLTSTVAGGIYTIAGKGSGGYSGDNGPATSATFELPSGISVDAHTRQLLIADSNNLVIRAVNMSTDVITTVAGDGTEGTSGDSGRPPRPSCLSRWAWPPTRPVTPSSPTGIPTRPAWASTTSGAWTARPTTCPRLPPTTVRCAEATRARRRRWHTTPRPPERRSTARDLYFSENFANVVCEVSASTGTVSVFAGTLNSPDPYSGDGGPATDASLSPFGLAVGNGNLYIADYQNDRVRAVNLTSKEITTVAGDGSAGETGTWLGHGGGNHKSDIPGR